MRLLTEQERREIDTLSWRLQQGIDQAYDWLRVSKIKATKECISQAEQKIKEIIANRIERGDFQVQLKYSFDDGVAVSMHLELSNDLCTQLACEER